MQLINEEFYHNNYEFFGYAWDVLDEDFTKIIEFARYTWDVLDNVDKYGPSFSQKFQGKKKFWLGMMCKKCNLL